LSHTDPNILHGLVHVERRARRFSRMKAASNMAAFIACTLRISDPELPASIAVTMIKAGWSF